MKINNNTNLNSPINTWIAGWINGGSSKKFQVLHQDGSFAAPNTPATVPFLALPVGDGALAITYSQSQVDSNSTFNGNNRLVFVVSPTQPADLTTSSNNPVQFTAYPWANTPGAGLEAPGPFDIFEFGMNAQDDLSSVNGFGLNLSFSVEVAGTTYQFGANQTLFRSEIGDAFALFIAKEAKSLPSASAYASLLYTAKLPFPPPGANPPAPPLVAGQFFAICDPNDQLAAETNNYTTATSDPLASYWDDTLAKFFTAGNHLSINLSANPTATNIYSGMCAETDKGLPTYSLSNGSNTYTFPLPQASGTSAPGLAGAQYVFQQAFGTLTPSHSSGDAGLLQDSIWEALCRGVAIAGVSKIEISNGESTATWNDPSKWYQEGTPCHLYGKFLHYGTKNGTDCRVDTSAPSIMVGNSAYAFSMDENPLGPYNGGEVPSKTPANAPDGSTITIDIGPWAPAPKK